MWQMTISEMVLPAAKLVIKLQGYTCLLVVPDVQLKPKQHVLHNKLLWQAHLAQDDRLA